MIIPRRSLLHGLVLALALACGPGPGSEVERDPPEQAQVEPSRPAVVFLGTSLTAGLGVPLELAFPALIQERIDAAGLDLRVVNAGVSGDTSAGGLRRIDWLLRQPLRVLVIELGANDMLRGLDPGALRSNLQEIIDRTRARHPDVRIVIAGMRAAPNLGETYGEGFARTYAELARQNGAVLIPFLLEGVAAVPELNQADGIHPNARGHRLIAESTWSALERVLHEVAGTTGEELRR